MRLTREQLEEAWAMIRAKKQGKFACPWCREEALRLQPSLSRWPDARGPDGQGRERSFSVLPLYCGSCGLVLPFHAVTLGLVTPALLDEPPGEA